MSFIPSALLLNSVLDFLICVCDAWCCPKRFLKFPCCYINNTDALIVFISRALQIDCPWFPDKHGKSHCTSSANFAGIYNVHETVEICCSEHFYNVNSCVENSIGAIDAQKEIVQKRLKRPRYYWPDLHGKQNCVFGSDYNDWMEGSVSFFTEKTRTF